MKSNRRLVNKICLSLVLAIAIYLPIVISQPSLAQTDFNLKSDIITLQSRISRLEQEVGRLRSSNSKTSNRATATKVEPPASPPNSNFTIVNPPEVNGEIIGRSDPLYEKLATLAIELKEDIQNLDRRLTKVEKKASFP